MLFIHEDTNKQRFNIVKEFHKYNKLIFNNELVLDFPLRWGSLKRSMGLVKFISDGRTKSPLNVVSLTLSNVYDFTPENFRDTLIHEMIHVYTVQHHVIEKPHGREFTFWMNKINRMGDYHITQTEEGELQVNSDRNVKPVYAFVQERLDGKKSHAIIKSYVKGEIILNLDLAHWSSRKNCSIAIYKVTNPRMLMFKQARNLDTLKGLFSFNSASEEENFNEILKTSPKIDYIFVDEKGRIQNLLK